MIRRRRAMTRMIISAKFGLVATIDRNVSVSISHSSAWFTARTDALRGAPSSNQCHLADNPASRDGFVDDAAAHDPEAAFFDDIERLSLVSFSEQELARAN